jgi:hypothetical protein
MSQYSQYTLDRHAKFFLLHAFLHEEFLKKGEVVPSIDQIQKHSEAFRRQAHPNIAHHKAHIHSARRNSAS